MKNITANMNKTALKTAVATALVAFGASMTSSDALAQVLPPGVYDIVINPTPTRVTAYGGTAFKFGSDGAWNSSFTFGGLPPSSQSQGMTDNGTNINTNGGVRGSSVAGDGYAGVLRITVDAGGENFTVSAFQKDAIFGTAGGTFVQYSTITGTGSIDPTNCQLTFTPTGRLGAISGFPSLYDERWVVDDFTNAANTAWTPFTTGLTTIPGGNSITGRQVTLHSATAGDVNLDGREDFQAIFVQGSKCGSEWGTFYGCSFFEVWNVDIISVSVAAGGTVGACTGFVPPPPPAAVSTGDASLSTFEPGVSGCSLSSASANVSEGGAWALLLGFLAWLKALAWRRKRDSSPV